MEEERGSHEQTLFLGIRQKTQANIHRSEPQVHGFSDGGECAYGASIFLRGEMSDGTSCVLVITKSFVAPLKKRIIPRLELLGCLALKRMYTTCSEALDIAGFAKLKKMF